jgi:hypothetical protein
MANDFALGLIAIAIGGLFCFRGYLAMRAVIPVWGGFTGFLVGAAAVSAVTGDGFLATLVSWLGGAVIALVFALLAYTYFEVSVLLAMGAIGFALGSSVMVAANVSWSWLIVSMGVAMGVLLAALAVMADLPMLVLTLLTATAGSTAVVVGTMLVVGSIETTELATTSTVERIQQSPGWWLVYLVVAVAGAAAQIRVLGSIRGSMRERWAGEGGRELRSA